MVLFNYFVSILFTMNYVVELGWANYVVWSPTEAVELLWLFKVNFYCRIGPILIGRCPIYRENSAEISVDFS